MENGRHFTFGIFLVISKIVSMDSLHDLQNMGVATITKALCALWTEIWSNIVLNGGHFSKWPPLYIGHISSH